MSEQRAGQRVTFSRPGCPHRGVVHVDQTVVGGELRWSRSSVCPTCGNVEEDGVSFPAEDVRAAFIRNHGAWAVAIDEADRTPAIRVLMKALSLAMPKAVVRARDLSRVFMGTKVEAEWIAGRLKDAGVSPRVVRAAD